MPACVHTVGMIGSNVPQLSALVEIRGAEPLLVGGVPWQAEFAQKQVDMREQVVKFEKFIQENDAKRIRAEAKAKQVGVCMYLVLTVVYLTSRTTTTVLVVHVRRLIVVRPLLY